MSTIRCTWVEDRPELFPYHDLVWGRPTWDDQVIFAALGQCILHAGLLWTALLKKRADFAAAFDGWDVRRIAAYDDSDMARLLEDPRVIRNTQKLSAILHDAGCYLAIQAEFGSFGSYIWSYADQPLDSSDPQARVLSERLSRDLKAKDFKFTGPATCYGLMQDIGLILVHDSHCHSGQDIMGDWQTGMGKSP